MQLTLRLCLLQVAPISPLLTSLSLIILHEQYKSCSLSPSVTSSTLQSPARHFVLEQFHAEIPDAMKTGPVFNTQFRSHCTAVICSDLSTSYPTQTHARMLYLDLTCDSTASDHNTFFTSPLETNFVLHVVLRTLSSSLTRHHWTKIPTKTLTYYTEKAWERGSLENVRK
jgi:hypothetical protein